MRSRLHRVPTGRSHPIAARYLGFIPLFPFLRSLLPLLPLLAIFACGDNQYAPPPVPAVEVAQPEVRDVTEYLIYTGITRAVETVDVRARVKGFLESMHFTAGERVQAGDLLFVIDPEPFEIELKAAEADFTSNQAERDLAQTEFERVELLYKEDATSEIIYIQARARRDKTIAALSAAEADVRTARLNIDYALVEAPITGRVGRHLIDMGNLVGASGNELLTQVIKYQPLHVFFQLSERDLLSLQEMGRRRREAMGKEWEDRDPTMIDVGKLDEEGFPHPGMVDYTALQVDPGTGTFEVRAVIDNQGKLDEIIIPGTFVRVRLPVGTHEAALLVSERALGADQSGRYLLVANSENIVEQRRVVVGPQRGDGLRVVRKGVLPEDWVIVNGLQRARPGAGVDSKRLGSQVPAARDEGADESGANAAGADE